MFFASLCALIVFTGATLAPVDDISSTVAYVAIKCTLAIGWLGSFIAVYFALWNVPLAY